MNENETTVNIPLLRKAVEWAEAEAAKPPELCEWEQGYWTLTPEERAQRLGYANGQDDYFTEAEKRAFQKAPECGTAYCIAGYVTALQGETALTGYQYSDFAQRLLGLDPDDADRLFGGDNTIQDVRRIAEDIAGQRL